MNTEIGDAELQRFVDGQLSPERRALVLEYLANHPDAKQRVDADLRHKRLLRQYASEYTNQPDDPVTARLQDELATRLAGSAARPRPWWRQTAAAMVLFAAGWGASVVHDTYREWSLPSVVNGATKAHQIFAENSRRPVELTAADSRELRHWFSEHLYADVDIPQLDSVGLSFIGGRLLATEQGPLAQMLYEDQRGRRLSFYVSAAEAFSEADVQVVKVDGFTAGYWKDDRLVYTLVADTSKEQLLAIAAVIGGE